MTYIASIIKFALYFVSPLTFYILLQRVFKVCYLRGRFKGLPSLAWCQFTLSCLPLVVQKQDEF